MSPSRRLSPVLLRLAATVTVLVLTAGSVLLWHLHGMLFDYRSNGMAEAAPQGTEPLVVGVGRTPGGPDEWITFARVFAQLQGDLDRPVRLRYILDQNESVDLMESGALDIALMSTRAYLDVQRESSVSVVAAPIIKGAASDCASLVVRADSEYEDLADLRGRSLVLPPDSLAGRSFVNWVLSRSDEVPDQYFGSVVERSSQDTNLAMVADGRADATCVRTSALAAWPERTFSIIASSPEFGMPPLVAREGLGSDVIGRIRESLLGTKDLGIIPPESAITGFRVPDDADYDFSRVLEEFGEKGPRSARGETP